MDTVMWWSVVTETHMGQMNVVGPFLLHEDAVEWATLWMREGFGRAGIAGLLEAEEAADMAGFEWVVSD